MVAPLWTCIKLVHLSFYFMQILIHDYIYQGLQFQITYKEHIAMEMDRLKRQLDRKEMVIIDMRSKISCLTDDCNTYVELNRKQAQEITTLKQSIKKLKGSIDEQEFQRQDVEGRYLLVLKKLEEELEQTKKKYQHMEAKIVPLLDHDSVRLKVLNQVEGNHQLELGKVKYQNQALKEEIHRLKRELQLTRHKFQSASIDHQQQLRRMRAARSAQLAQNNLNYMSFEMNKQIENRLKNSLQQAKKEAEYYKQKYFQGEKRYQERIGIKG